VTVLVLADGTGPDGSVGVLVDDPDRGRLLLDCGVGVPAGAAFAGISLAGVRVLTTGPGPGRRDPAIPPAALLDVAVGAAPPPGVRVLPAGGTEVALLVETAQGVLLHCPAAGPLPEETLARLPERVVSTVPLAAAVRAQLVGRADVTAARPGRRVLVTGGARSGKSQAAEGMLAGRDGVVYLATGAPATPEDAEWSARVVAHQDRRPATWSTVETSNAAGVLAATGGARAGEAAVLFDCVGTWLTAAMDATGLWAATEAGGPALAAADASLAAAIDELVTAWAATGAHVVAVTNEVGSGVVPATASGRRFRDELGRLNARLAARADEVWLCTAGIAQRIR
jgi:adenosyl cobinamide kinase/adenosyl cobinamide phosphate guanylyltransferase